MSSLLPTCWNNACFRDQACHYHKDCCSDISDIGCFPVKSDSTSYTNTFVLSTSTTSKTSVSLISTLLLPTSTFTTDTLSTIVIPTPTNTLGKIMPYISCCGFELLIIGSCLSLNLSYKGCCLWTLSTTCNNNGCYCDQACYIFSDCCSDIVDISCFPVTSISTSFTPTPLTN